MTLHAVPRPATSSQPQRLVLSPHRDPDRQQSSGEWLSAVAVVTVKR